MAEPVLVLHFTQGTTIAGAVATMRKARSECHEVIDPALSPTATQQLLPWTTPARSLKHPAGRPETNNRGFGSNPLGRCYQIEIVGYSEKAATYGDVWYQRLAYHLDARCTALRIPPVFPLPFVGSQSYGSSAPTRLTWDAWARISGIVGHQHVPGNDHWDPGALDVTRLTRYMETTTMPPPENDPGARIQRAINANGLQPPLKIDGDCGPATAAGLDQVLTYLNGQIADLTRATKISADTTKRLIMERDEGWDLYRAAQLATETAVANREAAEAEAAKLRAELQTGGRIGQLLADLDAAMAHLAQAMGKARA